MDGNEDADVIRGKKKLKISTTEVKPHGYQGGSNFSTSFFYSAM